MTAAAEVWFNSAQIDGRRGHVLDSGESRNDEGGAVHIQWQTAAHSLSIPGVVIPLETPERLMLTQQ